MKTLRIILKGMTRDLLLKGRWKLFLKLVLTMHLKMGKFMNSLQR